MEKYAIYADFVLMTAKNVRHCTTLPSH